MLPTVAERNRTTEDVVNTFISSYNMDEWICLL